MISISGMNESDYLIDKERTTQTETYHHLCGFKSKSSVVLVRKYTKCIPPALAMGGGGREKA